jgi:hypothetical protein
MVKLHTGMDAGLSPAELDAQFAANVHLFERLTGQIVSKVIEGYANQPENRQALQQIQRWQTDSYLAELIAIYRRTSRSYPITSSWIAIKQQVPELERAGVAR